MVIAQSTPTSFVKNRIYICVYRRVGDEPCTKDLSTVDSSYLNRSRRKESVRHTIYQSVSTKTKEWIYFSSQTLFDGNTSVSEKNQEGRSEFLL